MYLRKNLKQAKFPINIHELPEHSNGRGAVGPRQI